MTNENFENLVRLFADSQYAVFSDSAHSIALDSNRFENALSAQSEFTREEIANEMVARHNAWIASLPEVKPVYISAGMNSLTGQPL